MIDYILSKVNNEFNEKELEAEILNLINNEIYLRIVNDEVLTTKYFYEVENFIVDTVITNSKICKSNILSERDLELYMDDCEIKQGFKYDSKQRDILRHINERSNLNILNGYAGTGKTTTAKGVLDLYSKFTAYADHIRTASRLTSGHSAEVDSYTLPIYIRTI